MEFAITFYPEANGPLSEAARQQAGPANLEYVERLEHEGVLRSGLRFSPEHEALVVQTRDGAPSFAPATGSVHGSPSGQIVIEAATIEAARNIAVACPFAELGVVELRPILRRLEVTR